MNLIELNPHRDPLVLDDVVDGEPLGGVGLEHPADQVLRVLGHVGPLWKKITNSIRNTILMINVRLYTWLWELVLSRPDPLLHPGRDGEAVVGVERGEAA